MSTEEEALLEAVMEARVQGWREGFDAAWLLVDMAARAGHAPDQLPHAIASSRDELERRYVEQHRSV